MSNRAEDAAFKAYPKSDFNGVETRRKGQRKCYIQGYEQAEKDTIERACEWLFRHYAVNLFEFRKAMEEE